MLMVSTNGIRSFNETGRAIYIPRFCPLRYDRCDKGELPRAVRHAYLISRCESAELVQGHRFTSEMPNQRNSNVHADKVLNWSLVSVSCHVLWLIRLWASHLEHHGEMDGGSYVASVNHKFVVEGFVLRDFATLRALFIGDSFSSADDCWK